MSGDDEKWDKARKAHDAFLQLKASHEDCSWMVAPADKRPRTMDDLAESPPDDATEPSENPDDAVLTPPGSPEPAAPAEQAAPASAPQFPDAPWVKTLA